MKIHAEKVALHSGLKGAVYHLWNGPNRQLHSCSGDGLVVNWPAAEEHERTQSARAVASLEEHIFTCATLPDGKFVLGGLKGGVHFVDPQKGTSYAAKLPADLPVFSLKKQGNSILTATGNGTLYKIDFQGNIEHEIKLSDKSLRGIAPEPLLLKTGKGRIAVPSSDGAVYLLDGNSLSLVQKLEGHERSVFTAAWSPDGNWLVSGSMDAHIHIWNPKDDLALDTRIPAHLLTVNHLVFHPSGKWMASGSRDKTIKIWSVPDFTLRKVLSKPKYEGHSHSVNCLFWDPEADLLWSGSDDKTIIGWKLNLQSE